MKWDYGNVEGFDCRGSGLFIASEGNFQYGNASLSYYDPETKTIDNDIFFRANGMKLGDVAHSMTMYGERLWIVVNNSHVVFAIDPVTFKEKGRITDLPSPRYIHFVSPDKAYITQLWSNRIYIADPSSCEVTGSFEIPGMATESGSTEQMVQYGHYVYCTCWSYQNSIVKIDTETDKVVDRLEIGLQPRVLVLDKYNRLWTITDGGYEGSPLGQESPALCCIDAESFKLVKRFKFKFGTSPSGLMLNNERDKLYWINDDVWVMDITSERLPVRPWLKSRGTKYYALTVSPETDDIYVADAIDYQQAGVIYRYSPDGEIVDEFFAGITPGAFCWRK